MFFAYCLLMISLGAELPASQPQAVPSFRNDVLPVLTRNGCNSGACHGALAGKGGLKLSLRGYDPESDHFALTRQALGRRVDLTEPHQSLLLRKPTLVLTHGGGHRIEVGSSDYKVLADWIAGGSPGMSEADARITRLEVSPSESRRQPGEKLQLQVTAYYDKGPTRNVTHWAKYTSSEELVAAVDSDGAVTVTGNGESAISIWFSNVVATSSISVPYPNTGSLPASVAGPQVGLIDEQIYRKLDALRIPISPPCTDGEFLRRAFLDSTGRLPDAGEIERFLLDRDPKKREKLVEALLLRSEFVDYWAYKWSDLFLVSTKRLQQPAVWAFYQHIRQAVADNKPWDRMARDILTASGGTLENGAANYFVLHKDVADLTEATAVTFLGMSITCCRCHNHPLEKWTQDQYWAMANLFSRVAIKNNERPGDFTVQALQIGDVPHPRRGLPMPPAPLDAKPMDPGSQEDRRRYFATWLTAPDNPYFARAIVNRVWRNYMGRGLVEAEDDLRQTNPATNEQLLQRLANDFVSNGYDLRRLMRQIMTSAAYQRASATVPGNEADDRFYSHYLVRRLPAEVVLDAYSQVTEAPTPFSQVHAGGTGGLSNYDGYPLGIRSLQLPDSQVASRFLDAFGRPDRTQACSCERQQDASISQALHLNNGQTLNDKLRAKGALVSRWIDEGITNEAAVRQLFVRSLCREPSEKELSKLIRLMSEGVKEGASRRDVLEDLVWGVLTGREFVFNH